MKKFTLIAGGFLAASMGFASHAQTMGDAVVIDPSGKYTSSIYNIVLQWDEDVEMVNPQFNGEGKEYFEATLSAGGKESTVQFTYNSIFDYETWDDILMKNQVTAYVYENLVDPTTWELYWGDVTLSLPGGVVINAAGEMNAPQTFEFVLMPSDWYNYTVTPENWSTANPSALKETTITFNGTITPLEGAGAIKILCDNVSSVLNAEKVTFTENAIILDLSELEMGMNEINVPAGMVIITDATGKQTINSNISITYTVWAGMAEGTVLYPKGFNIDTLDEPVKITWNCPITLNEEASATIYCYNAEMYYEPIPAAAVTIEGENLCIDLTSFAGSFPSGASIEVNLPAGLVTGEEGPNPRQDISFYYYEPYNQDAEFELDNGTIYITWPGVNDIGCSYDRELCIVAPDGTSTSLTWSQYGGEGDVKIPGYDEPFAYERVEANLSGIEFGQGEYTLVVPSLLFFFYLDEGNFTNAGCEFTFNPAQEGMTSGMQPIGEADGIFRVYNLQGVNIMNTTDRNAVERLSNGLYIINGKKVMIKR